jgi:hypothetical protein
MKDLQSYSIIKAIKKAQEKKPKPKRRFGSPLLKSWKNLILGIFRKGKS